MLTKFFYVCSFFVMSSAFGSDVVTFNNDGSFSTNQGFAAPSSCVCHGGPGDYIYSCPPVLETCHGGFDDYTYACYVCPK